MKPVTPARHLLIDIEHWRRGAEEAGAAAETTRDATRRQTMLAIASTYNCLIEAGEWQLGHNAPVSARI
jgi:hypothetical protein